MSENFLPTESYKGVRDFYPKDMAIQRYIFNSWSKTAEIFGFEKYDASILEPADLYKAKGAENEEMVNQQTYTFIDRGEREVTLRPEMTPTVARLVAGKRRELNFPLRWYSIPNLFRYERPQRGRLREHWQLNCDIFGADHFTADVELIALAYQTLIDFGATPDMFEIRLNNRKILSADFARGAQKYGVDLKDEQILKISRLIDRIEKINPSDFEKQMVDILGNDEFSKYLLERLTSDMDDEVIHKTEEFEDLKFVYDGLINLGIKNIKVDLSLMRGFDYYTGTIFEIFDKHPGGTKRAMLGGGRYDNLTAMFSSDKISGVGFGMGDVTMRDFLETHNLLPAKINTAPELMIIPLETKFNLEGEKIAQIFRQREIKTAVDISENKLSKKISDASLSGVPYVMVIGEDELSSLTFSLKNLSLGTTESGSIDTLLNHLTTHF